MYSAFYALHTRDYTLIFLMVYSPHTMDMYVKKMPFIDFLFCSKKGSSMPRIQTFVSNQVREEIESLVTERRQEGATEVDATVSSVTSMLIELGLRVYRIQRERKESGFNQMEYNKVMLDSMARVRMMCTEIMKMGTLSQESLSDGGFKLDNMRKAIDRFAEDQVGIFFAEEEKD